MYEYQQFDGARKKKLIIAVHVGGMDLICTACTEAMRVDRGCEKDSIVPGKWKIGDFEVQRCPKKILTHESNQCITAYNFYKNGIMPRPGGWMDQSAKFIEVIQVIDGEISEIEKERIAEMKKS